MGLPCSSQLITGLIRQLSALPIVELEDHARAEGPQSYHSDKRLNGVPNSNPLAKLPADTLAKVKPLLLTLHTIFPNELLLALDILDRKLVTRYIVQQDTHGEENQGGKGRGEMPMDSLGEDGGNVHGIYFVQSSAAAAASTNPRRGESHSHPVQVEQSYEVCLHSWNCTCSAFALAAFQDLALGNANHEASSRLDSEYRGQQGHQNAEGQERRKERSEGPRTKDAGEEERKLPDWIFGGSLTRSPTCPTRCVFMHDAPPICKHLLACVLCSQCPALFQRGMNFAYINKEELAARHAGWAG